MGVGALRSSSRSTAQHRSPVPPSFSYNSTLSSTNRFFLNRITHKASNFSVLAMAEVEPDMNGGASQQQQLANGSNPDPDRAPGARESESSQRGDPSGARSEALMGEGHHTFTMRELLNELEEDGSGSGSEGNKNADSPSFSYLCLTLRWDT